MKWKVCLNTVQRKKQSIGISWYICFHRQCFKNFTNVEQHNQSQNSNLKCSKGINILMGNIEDWTYDSKFKKWLLTKKKQESSIGVTLSFQVTLPCLVKQFHALFVQDLHYCLYSINKIRFVKHFFLSLLWLL